jgi:hypothetical protein
VNNIIEFLVGIIVGIQTNCKNKFGRKIQLNAFKFGPMTYGTFVFNEFL